MLVKTCVQTYKAVVLWLHNSSLFNNFIHSEIDENNKIKNTAEIIL